jgi:hypothetical protein
VTVKELREALEAMPDHIAVHVGVRADGSGGGADTDFLYTLECRLEAFPTQGRIAVIYPNYEPR